MPGCASHKMMAANENAIREADMAWAKASAAKDFEGSMSYIADDATIMCPNMPKTQGIEAIRKVWRAIWETPGFLLNFHPSEVKVARSGDIGYVIGTYEMTKNDATGYPVTDKGSYVEVWRKQANGVWKCVVDIFNSDLPLPADKWDIRK